MSELTKIAAFLFKNLSDALLQTASDISKLDAYESKPETFTQADDTKPILGPEKPKFTTHFQYNPREKVIVIFEGSLTPIKCKVLRRIDISTYVVCPQRAPKSMAREINIDQILGLDPDR
jgi:hypothetical protein